MEREPREKGWQRRWKPRAKLPAWREAEEYFRAQRDGKVPVTLPRVRFLELEEAEA